MTEPRHRAAALEAVVPGVRRFGVEDDRIGFRSDAYAVGGGPVVLVDPLPLADEALAGLGPVEAVVITGGHHQRASWRVRRQLGAAVLAPAGAHGLEERPDAEYRPGDDLPGGLRAHDAAGPAVVNCALWRDEGRVLFIGDVVIVHPDGRLAFVADQHQDDPAASRRSLRRLLELPVEVVCPAHGAPITAAARGALEALLRADAGSAPG